MIASNESMRQFFYDIYLILTLDCEGSARLTSDSIDRKLRWSETVAMKAHQLICAKSRRLDRQLLQLNAGLEKGHEGELSPAARQRIQQAIDKRLNED